MKRFFALFTLMTLALTACGGEGSVSTKDVISSDQLKEQPLLRQPAGTWAKLLSAHQADDCEAALATILPASQPDQCNQIFGWFDDYEGMEIPAIEWERSEWNGNETKVKVWADGYMGSFSSFRLFNGEWLIETPFWE